MFAENRPVLPKYTTGRPWVPATDEGPPAAGAVDRGLRVNPGASVMVMAGTLGSVNAITRRLLISGCVLP